MKKILYALVLLAVVVSCKKDNNDDDQTDGPLDVTWSFDSESTIDNWTIVRPNNAQVSIDTDDKFAGAGSLYITSGCAVLTYKKEFTVKPNTDYGLTVNAKRTPWGPNDTICTYQYPVGIFVLQGGIELFGSAIGDSPNWKTESFYFNSHEGTEPITLRFMINSKEVWLDEIKLEEI